MLGSEEVQVEEEVGKTKNRENHLACRIVILSCKYQLNGRGNNGDLHNEFHTDMMSFEIGNENTVGLYEDDHLRNGMQRSSTELIQNIVVQEFSRDHTFQHVVPSHSYAQRHIQREHHDHQKDKE